MSASKESQRSPRAAVYARVSTEEQADHGTSLTNQVERCRAYATSQAWTLEAEFVDEGVSGALGSRPALDRLLDAVREGQVDAVIVAKLDRLGRSMRHLSTLLGELDDRGVRIVSVAEAFDSATASGRLQRNILGSFAEFEREQIRERTSSGVAAVARDGFWPGGPPPFGWAIAADPVQTHRARLVIDEAEAAAVRVAVAAVVDENLSTGQAATRLNDLAFRPRKAPAWHGHLLRHLLLNLPLSGEWVWRRGQDRSGRRRQGDGVPIAMSVPALIDTATHDRLIAVLADRSTGQRSNMRQRFYLLSRRLTSPHGAPMSGFPRRNAKRSYICRDALGAGSATQRCSCRRIDADAVEEAVWGEVVALLSEPDRLVALAEVALDMRVGEREIEADQLAALDRRIRRLEDALSNDLADFITRGIDNAAVRRATAKLDRDLADLRRERAQLAAWRAANQLTAERASQLLGLAAEAGLALDQADSATQRRLIDLLDVRVRIDDWVPCGMCKGKGLLPAPTDQIRDDRARTGVVCPTCRRGRWLPCLTIHGVLPLDSADVDVPDVPDVLPFELKRTYQVAEAG